MSTAVTTRVHKCGPSNHASLFATLGRVVRIMHKCRGHHPYTFVTKTYYGPSSWKKHISTTSTPCRCPPQISATRPRTAPVNSGTHIACVCPSKAGASSACFSKGRIQNAPSPARAAIRLTWPLFGHERGKTTTFTTLTPSREISQ